MDKHGVRLPESTAALVRDSETAVGDSSLTERAALEYVRALNAATHALDPRSKDLGIKAAYKMTNENERN
jgi:CRISPR/Cas system-associated protein Csm6